MSVKAVMEPILSGDYEKKKVNYYDVPRSEMIGFVPTERKRLLDVGCGGGAFGACLRRRNNCEVWGVEPNLTACNKAEANLDRAIHGCFGPELGLPSGHFDCIIFNDVLEHMYDPASALRLASELLQEDGCVVASIPNIGHFPTVWRLAVRGEWEYKERGILDKTHLRFFTQRSIREMFQRDGFELERLEGINPFFLMDPGDPVLWRRYRLISWLSIPGIRDMRYLQFGVLARKGKCVGA